MNKSKKPEPPKKQSPAPKPPSPAPKPLPPDAASASAFHNPLKLDNAVAFVSGTRGTGKTTLALELALSFKKVVVYDPRGQVFEKLRERKAKFAAVRSIDEFVEAVLKTPNNFLIVYLPSEVKPEFEILCHYLRATPFKDTLFLIDEVSMNCDTYNIPPDFEHLIRFGRHDRIGLIMTAQRPVDVNRDLTAQCTHLFIFHQHEPNDVKYFSGFVGDKVSRLPDLKDHAFLYSDFKETKIFDKNGRAVIS